MKSCLVAVGFLMVAAVGVSTLPVLGQTTWSVPRTPDGRPDLQGVWDFRTITPFERPDELAGKEVMTPEEAAAFREETLRVRNKDQRASDGISVQRDVANAYNEFWWDYGDRLTDDGRTSLVFEPEDGRIPALTSEADRRAASPAAQQFEATRSGVAPASSWEDMDLGDRCILGFNSGPPMTPSAPITTTCSSFRRRDTWRSSTKWSTTRVSFPSMDGRISPPSFGSGWATREGTGTAIRWSSRREISSGRPALCGELLARNCTSANGSRGCQTLRFCTR